MAAVVVISDDTFFGFKIKIELLNRIIQSKTFHGYRVYDFFEDQSFVS